MPAKKAAKTRKPARKAATRKAPTARKTARNAKSAPRKAKGAPPRPAAGKAARKKTRKSVQPALKSTARGAAGKTTKPVRVVAPQRESVAVKPRSPAPVTEARPAPLGAPPRVARRPVFLDEEDEASGTHNLLLGPRNVRPYHERKGERYMGKDQLEHFRAILNSWKRDLMEEVDRTMTHMKDEAANPPDPNDRATLESEFALELRTRDRERKLIRKIDEALDRIDDGSYGYCIETGEPIGVKRLEARPVATLCIEAQERRERREKQYGDRDDWYR